MRVLTVGKSELALTIRRSAEAKRARLTLTPGRLEIVVPEAATEEQISKVLERRRPWLVVNAAKMERKARLSPSVSRYATGAKIPYRGRMMRLTVRNAAVSVPEVEYKNGFVVPVPAALTGAARDRAIATALRLWLKQRVRRDVMDLAQVHGEPNGLKPRSIRAVDLKHMWGSCGKDRTISINWQLIFAPKSVLEYAVVHELAHLKYRSHQPGFWSAIGAILPDWEKRKRWLDENEHLLSVDFLSVG